MSVDLQPLERHVKTLLQSKPEKLPVRTVQYWDRYAHLVSSLREHVYPHINAGLACLSKSPGIYTDHGESHFDEVVRYAGLLLNNPVNDKPHGLTPYEFYLLLCAIRLHDAGNIDGREQHEKRVSSILARYGGSIALDTPEADLISKIAEAHGGVSMSGDKDTIITLPDNAVVGATICRPRHVAALVRFADEICEHRARSASHHISAGTLPDENKLYHYYATSIAGAVPDRSAKTFRLSLQIKTEYLIEQYITPKKSDGTQDQLYLIDEVLNRLIKLDRERSYCNQFLDPEQQTRQIEIEIRLLKSLLVGGVQANVEVQKFELKIPTLQGYPDASNGWQSSYPELAGDKLAVRATKEWS